MTRFKMTHLESDAFAYGDKECPCTKDKKYPWCEAGALDKGFRAGFIHAINLLNAMATMQEKGGNMAKRKLKTKTKKKAAKRSKR